MAEKQAAGADLEAQINQARQEQERCNRQLAEIASQKSQMVDTQALVDQEASELEARIRQLAKEEAEVQRCKRVIQEEAKGIGRKRRELMDRSKELVAEQGRLEQTIGELQARQASLQSQKDQVQKDQAAVERARQAAAAPRPAEAPPAAPAEPAEAEQRQSKRIAVAVDVSMETPHNFYMGLTENLSEGGLFVATYDEVPLGTEMELRLSLPGSPPIKTRGIVRWIRQHSEFTEDMVPGIGLEMVDLSAADTKAIRDFLAERDPIYYENLDMV